MCEFYWKWSVIEEDSFDHIPKVFNRKSDCYNLFDRLQFSMMFIFIQKYESLSWNCFEAFKQSKQWLQRKANNHLS